MIHRPTFAPLTAGEERRRAAMRAQRERRAQFVGGAAQSLSASDAAARHPHQPHPHPQQQQLLDMPPAPLVELADVAALLRAYGVPLPPRDLALYRRALTHTSMAAGGGGGSGSAAAAPAPSTDLDCNERLEFAGDGVIESVFKTHVVRRFPHLREDRLTYIKVALVNNVTIGCAVRAMGLDRWYQIAPECRLAVMRDDKAMGDLFEAFVGAIVADYDDARVGVAPRPATAAAAASGDWCVFWPPLDERGEEHQGVVASGSGGGSSGGSSSGGSGTAGAFMRMGRGPGYMLAQQFVEGVYDRHVDWTALLATESNYKGVLQERMQNEMRRAPVYAFRMQGSLVQMSVWWNWGTVPRDRPLVRRLEEFASFDALRRLQASEPYVHLLLADLPPMRGTVKEIEQHAAAVAFRALPPSSAAGAKRALRPVAEPTPEAQEPAAAAAAAAATETRPEEEEQPKKKKKKKSDAATVVVPPPSPEGPPPALLRRAAAASAAAVPPPSPEGPPPPSLLRRADAVPPPSPEAPPPSLSAEEKLAAKRLRDNELRRLKRAQAKSAAAAVDPVPSSQPAATAAAAAAAAPLLAAPERSSAPPPLTAEEKLAAKRLRDNELRRLKRAQAKATAAVDPVSPSPPPATAAAPPLPAAPKRSLAPPTAVMSPPPPPPRDEVAEVLAASGLGYRAASSRGRVGVATTAVGRYERYMGPAFVTPPTANTAVGGRRPRW